jgi:DNA-binding LacI/PurR family transcriptional regulator
LVHNDDGAEGVLRALREAGLRVPQDVSVVGFDGTEVSAHLTPPLTTMEVPLQEVGRRGLELLLECRANAAMAPALELLPCKLLVRDSAAPPPHLQTDRQGENP